MPKYCRAPHCSNAAGQTRPLGRCLSFYKFPLHDAPRLRRWLAQMRRENWLPTRHQHLCSDHFEPSCFQHRWGVRYLRPDAVPTIFPCSPTEKLSTQPKQPLSGAEPVPPAQPLVPKSTSPEPGVTKPGDNPEGVPGRTIITQVPPPTSRRASAAIFRSRGRSGNGRFVDFNRAHRFHRPHRVPSDPGAVVAAR
ncbi:THAP domain-containing protein 8-like isoform X2 [Strix aluco]|uniref:THAP domain-containing protein 8-like isoform X2 n=1 Tax=Strix aluco TaxID=111821 RepID=UPI003DA29D55